MILNNIVINLLKRLLYDETNNHYQKGNQMKKFLLSIIIAMNFSAALAEEVNIYTLRQPELLEPILQEFTKKTGIDVNATWVQDGILARLKAEGKASKADAILTVDVGRLDEMAKAHMLQPIQSKMAKNRTAAHFRGAGDLWIALTLRSRIIVTSKDRMSMEESPESYEELADPKYQGKICTRSMKHVYNIGVIASMIAHHGEADAKKWLSALKDNLARRPSGNDRAQAKAIYEGACDIAIMNSYYLGKMATNEKETVQKEWFNALNIIFPNQDDRGAHVNISGYAILKNAKNQENAEKLLTFLLSDEAQTYYASLNFEVPVVEDVKKDPLVESWGNYKIDPLNLQAIADNTKIAAQLVDETRIDF